MRDARIYEKPIKGVHQIPNIISIATSQGHARMCEKRARGVYKSSRKSGTPIPWETLECTRKPPEGCTKYPISLVLQYSKAAPEQAKNTPEGCTNHPETALHQFHERRQNIRNTTQRVTKYPTLLVLQYPKAAPERAKNTPEGFTTHHGRAVHQSLEYTKNLPGRYTKYPISLALPYSKVAQERAKNTPEECTNHPETAVHQFHERR